MSSLLGGFAGIGGGSIGRASVDLVLNASAYQSQLAATEGETKAATSSMGQGFAGFQQQVKSSFSGAQVAAVGFGAVAAGAIVKAIGATTSWADEVRSLQNVTGQSSESASELASAANSLGINVTQLNTGFGLLEKNIVNNSTSLTKYGIVTRDAEGQILPFNEILGNVSDKYATLATQADKTAFAQNVFGRSGKALIPILNEQSTGLQELYDKTAPGLILTQQQVDAAKQLSIAERDLGEAFKGVAVSIGNQFVPVATRVLDDLISLVNLIDKVPGPVKAAALSFIALNGALVAIRGVWGVVQSTVAANAQALGAHAAAVEADASATEAATAANTVATQANTAATEGNAAATEASAAAEVDATAATAANTVATARNTAAMGFAAKAANLLNSEMVNNLAGIAALAKGTQDAVSEFDSLKAGNYGDAIHAITSEMHLYTGGVVQATPATDSFIAAATAVQQQVQAGTLTVADATTQIQALSDQYGLHLPAAAVSYIAAMTPATAATADASTAATDLSGSQAQLARTTQDAAKAAYKHAEAIRTEREALLSEAGGFTGLIASMDTVKTDQEALNKLRDQGKQGTAAYSEAVRKTTIDQLSYRDSLRQVADQLRQAGDGMGKVKGILREMATQAGISGNAFRNAFHSAFSSAGADITNLNNKLDQLKAAASAPIVLNVNSSQLAAASKAASNLANQLARGL